MATRKNTTIKRKVKNWTAADSAELYCIDAWSNGFFGVSRNGDVTVNLVDTMARMFARNAAGSQVG